MGICLLDTNAISDLVRENPALLAVVTRDKVFARVPGLNAVDWTV